jgi:hypothetical protein
MRALIINNAIFVALDPRTNDLHCYTRCLRHIVVELPHFLRYHVGEKMVRAEKSQTALPNLIKADFHLMAYALTAVLEAGLE